MPEGQKQFDVVELRFKNSRKGFYRNSTDLQLHVGDVVAVDAAPGHDIGIVSVVGELVKVQMRKKGVKDTIDIRKIFRKAHEEDIATWHEARKKEKETMIEARKLAEASGLTMKISDVEFQGDGSKATFYYTAEDRVDFRELIRSMADTFKVRIEMRQIGSRQEAQRLGGIGSCGRELCCSTWLTDFRSVSTSAARYQQLALNPQKLAGQCGKLKCCLNYELDSYIEAVKEFPAPNTRLYTERGNAHLFKTDIFKKKLWFFYEDTEAAATPVCLDLSSVKEILELNKKGEKPRDLRDFEPVEEEEVDDFYGNVVGQDSLTRFDERKKKKKRRKGGGNKPENRSGSGTARPERQNKPDSGGAPDQRAPKKPQAPGSPANEGGQSPRPKSRRPNRNKRKGPRGEGSQGKPQGNA